jgi:hypothetical protein
LFLLLLHIFLINSNTIARTEDALQWLKRANISRIIDDDDDDDDDAVPTLSKVIS